MKKLFLKTVTVVCILFFIGCTKNETNSSATITPTPAPPTSTSQSLTVVLSRNEINADGFDETIITVKDKDNTDVTGSSSIYVDNILAGSNIYYTGIAGNYKIKATRNNTESPVVSLNAVSPGASPFTQKVVTEMYTGTWCGICPGTIIPLEDFIRTRKDIIYVGVHGPSGSGDPYQYTFDAQLRTAFGVGGVPTVVVNRATIWDAKNATLDQLTKQRPPLGIALESSIAGNVINAKMKVKFDVSTSIPLKFVLLLVENDLKYNQANYGHFNLPNPIVNFSHQNVLRAAGTDIFGDKIPVATQTKGTTWEKTISLNAAGYNLSNCRLIGYVLYDTNTQNRKGILNVQIANAGENKNFD